LLEDIKWLGGDEEGDVDAELVGDDSAVSKGTQSKDSIRDIFTGVLRCTGSLFSFGGILVVSNSN
jgi:hypothetical protein